MPYPIDKQSAAELLEDIRGWATELGFQQLGVTDVDLGEHEDYLQKWLDAGYHGSMAYMARHGSKRSRPAELVPDTCRVIALRMDTGVVFCAARDFDVIGGYNEERYFGEDVEFLWSLKRLGRQRGQRLARVTQVKAVSSTRKFDRHGDWHYFTMLFRLLPMMLRSPEASTDVIQRYWYGDDR